jgi:hypothetical protein
VMFEESKEMGFGVHKHFLSHFPVVLRSGFFNFSKLTIMSIHLQKSV